MEAIASFRQLRSPYSSTMAQQLPQLVPSQLPVVVPTPQPPNIPHPLEVAMPKLSSADIEVSSLKDLVPDMKPFMDSMDTEATLKSTIQLKMRTACRVVSTSSPANNISLRRCLLG